MNDPGRTLRVAAVEPYFGGSHRQFLEDLQRHSRHRIELWTLPARLWKWRVRGAALHLAPALNAAAAAGASPGFDVFLCSDIVNVPDLRALLAPALRSVPVLYFLHENQLSYPLSPNETFDPYFGFTNVLSCLSAEVVAFNSEFHRRDFLEHLPGILPRLPDYEPRRVAATIAAKAEVLPLGLDVHALEAERPGSREAGGPRRILWNHRWEFDKRPEVFFAALSALAARDVPYRAAVVGASFTRRPPAFDAARARLGAHLDRWGYVESRREYIQVLWSSDIVVSTASQEFFGIAMAEAVLCGAHPVAPDGLVYRDLYAGECASLHLYRRDEDLAALLERLLVEPRVHACPIPGRLRALGWDRVGPQWDARLASVVA